MSILLAVAVAAALGAAPETETEPKKIKLASPGIAGVNLAKDKAEFFSDHLAQELSSRGIRVITAKEVNAILGLARSQQLMGCEETSTSCMTELADALGVDGIITGSVGQFGPSFTANINIVASGDGRLLGSVVVRADSEKQLLDRLAVEAQRAAAEVGSRLGKPVRRYFSQALDLDPLLLLFGGVRLSYTRPLGDRWSLLVAWSLEVNQVDPEFPNLALSNMDVAAQARYHLLGRAPFGLYLGAGLLIHSTTGFLDDPTVQAAIGVMGAALSAEAGYDLVLFDFLHLGLGFGGFLGLSSFAFAATGGQSGGELRTLQGWALSTRTGFAF